MWRDYAFWLACGPTRVDYHQWVIRRQLGVDQLIGGFGFQEECVQRNSKRFDVLEILLEMWLMCRRDTYHLRLWRCGR